jgi:hypothetical protein
MVLTLTVIVMSFMLNNGANVKKNWLKAAHFHWRLSCATLSEKTVSGGKAGDDA